MIPSDLSPAASNPYGDRPEESLPAQFASVNKDDGCFDENNALLCQPTPVASEASPGLNGYGWEQLWLADQQSLDGAVAVPPQQDVPPGQLNTAPHASGYDFNTNSFGYTAWPNQIASPTTEPVSLATSPASHSWPQVQVSTTEQGYRRRNPHSDQHSPPQFTKLDPASKGRVSTHPRRDSEHSENLHDNNGGGNNGGKKQDNKTRNQNEKKEKKTASTGLQDDEQYRRIQHRNRVASNKFRNKKREDALILQAKVEELEQTNGRLVSCKEEFVQQIQYCKMLLLQHAECQCVLIQNYIAVEADRYIRDIQQNPSRQHANPT